VLAPGAQADLILVDYHPTTPLTAGNLPWHMIFGFHESMVTTTIVAGRLLMQDRRLLTLDEEEITARARVLAPAVWQRYAGYVPPDN
jgi:cytosine/adenosine deaminase-related metal-dependent hydrolase